MAKENKKNDNIIGRIFECILYNNDGPVYFNQLLKLENLCIDNNYSYYYITHDKDKKEDGTDAEVHTHYLIYTNGSTTTLDHISKECDIKPNKIEKKNYLSSSIKYLTHESTFSKEKALYNWKDILSNDYTRVNKIYENLDENCFMKELISFIDKQNKVLSYREFVDYVLQNDMWSYYRRSASIIKMLIDEHNDKIKQSW